MWPHISYGFAYVQLPPPIIEKLQSLYDSIPNEWKVDNQGRSFGSSHPVQRFHSTFVSKLRYKNKVEIIEKMRLILGTKDPVDVQLGDQLFLQQVDRIQTSTVYCLGISLVGNDLRKLREECVEQVGGEVYYNGDGHISICYIKEEFYEQLRQIMNQNASDLEGKKFKLQTIVVNFGKKKTELVLGES